jgi:hypothetical protein
MQTSFLRGVSYDPTTLMLRMLPNVKGSLVTPPCSCYRILVVWREREERHMARKPTDQVHLKLRFTERLRKQIEQAAAHNNRSMNEEIIRRLEESFTMGDLTKTLVRTVEKTIQATITSSGAGYTPSTGYPPHPVKPENS